MIALLGGSRCLFNGVVGNAGARIMVFWAIGHTDQDLRGHGSADVDRLPSEVKKKHFRDLIT